MRVVATGTVNLAFAHGHVGGAEHFCPFVPMTLETGFLGIFGDGKLALALLLHHIVTIRTADA